MPTAGIYCHSQKILRENQINEYRYSTKIYCFYAYLGTKNVLLLVEKDINDLMTVEGVRQQR